jgi:exosortase
MELMTKSPERSGSVTELHLTRDVRLVFFFLVSVLPLFLGWIFMRTVAGLALSNDTYSHIPLVPVVSLFVIYFERQRIFSRASSGWRLGSLLLLAGAVCFALGESNPWHGSPGNVLSTFLSGVVLTWTGAFALAFGTNILRAATFPFLFLLFMIPIPEPLLSRTILLLQKGSADTAGLIFNVFGVPFLRQGFDFALPGLVIRVAEECSGIRSWLALLITAVLASRLFLHTTWRKILICVLVFPIAVVKNSLRIVTLSALALYVDPGFLYGRLHKYGGVPFFLFGLLMLMSLFMVLRRSEASNKKLTQRSVESVVIPDDGGARGSHAMREDAAREQ